MKNLLKSASENKNEKLLFLENIGGDNEVVSTTKEEVVSPETVQKLQENGKGDSNDIMLDIDNMLYAKELADAQNIIKGIGNNVDGTNAARKGESQIRDILSDIVNPFYENDNLVKIKDGKILKTYFVEPVMYEGDMPYQGMVIKSPQGKSFIQTLPNGIKFAGEDGEAKTITIDGPEGTYGMIGDTPVEAYQDYSDKLAPMYVELKNIYGEINKENFAMNNPDTNKDDPEKDVLMANN